MPKWLLFLLLLPQAALAGEAAKLLDTQPKALEAYARAQELILEKGLPRRNAGELTEAAIQGMIASLDPYGELMTKAQVQEMEQASMGRYLGVGILVSQKEQAHFISRVYPQSPAARAGLARGMEIVSINGVQIANHPAPEMLFGQMGGVLGQKVEVKIRFQGKEQVFRLQVAEIQYPSTRFERLPGGVLLIEMTDFLKDSAAEIKAEWAKERPQAVVLDLRGNPGGLLYSAIEVADLFLPQGEIVSLQGPQGERLESYQAHGLGYLGDFPFAVLIDRNSASSAEILAGALQDHQRARLFGEQSFGKGSIQSLFEITDELVVKLTIAHYQTPKGRKIHHKGIAPDQPVAENLNAPLHGRDDLPLQAALTWLAAQKR